MAFPEEKTVQRNEAFMSKVCFVLDDEVLEYEVQAHHRLIIGRTDNDITVDVDLSPYGAYRLGVSRQHIYLEQRYGKWFVIDMGSQNNTWLNGRKLPALVAHILSDGDLLQLSNMYIRVYFE